MKIDNEFVFKNKWISYLVIGSFGPLISGLGQWVDQSMWPPPINWIVILAGCAIGCATQNLAFFSSAWSDLKKKLNGDMPPPEVKP
jgi:hypothetical protein